MFPIVAAPSYFPNSSVGEFPFLHTFCSICYLQTLIMGILTSVMWYFTVVLICISLIISNVEHLFSCLLIICVFFGEMSIYIFCPLLIELFVYFAVELYSCLYVLEIKPCWSHHLQIFSPISQIVFFFFFFGLSFLCFTKILSVLFVSICLFLFLFLFPWDIDIRRQWYNLCTRKLSL